MTKVGEHCDPHRDQCPASSYCDRTRVCTCHDGLRPHEDRRYCRKALYGETCDTINT